MHIKWDKLCSFSFKEITLDNTHYLHLKLAQGSHRRPPQKQHLIRRLRSSSYPRRLKILLIWEWCRMKGRLLSVGWREIWLTSTTPRSAKKKASVSSQNEEEHCPRNAVYGTLSTGHYLRDTVCGTQSTGHSLQDAVYGTLSTRHSLRNTVHGTQSTGYCPRDTVYANFSNFPASARRIQCSLFFFPGQILCESYPFNDKKTHQPVFLIIHICRPSFVVQVIILFSTPLFVGQKRVVGIATRYGLACPEIESRWRWDFSHPSRPVLGLNQPPV
jgi:hypothetical protein